MGDNYLESQAKNTEKRRARAADSERQPRLLVRPDEQVDEFTIDIVNNSTLASGETLRCLPDKDGSISVARHHRRVGRVNSDGAKVLRESLGDRGVCTVRVSSVDDATLTARAQVTK